MDKRKVEKAFNNFSKYRDIKKTHVIGEQIIFEFWDFEKKKNVFGFDTFDFLVCGTIEEAIVASISLDNCGPETKAHEYFWTIMKAGKNEWKSG